MTHRGVVIARQGCYCRITDHNHGTQAAALDTALPTHSRFDRSAFAFRTAYPNPVDRYTPSRQPEFAHFRHRTTKDAAPRHRAFCAIVPKTRHSRAALLRPELPVAAGGGA